MSLAARRSDRSTRAALKRVLRARARKGLAELDRADGAPAVHELRKRTKELRGLLCALRPGLPGAKRIDLQLRAAAKALSVTRDLEVMLQTFDTLTAERRDPSRFAGLRMQIFDAYAKRGTSKQRVALDEYKLCFKVMKRDMAGLSLKRKASRLLWDGIFSTYADAQSKLADANESLDGDFDPGPFHDMRKAVKRHWYQARFLAAIRPKKMADHIRRIDDLGEALGDHNDLDVLMVFLDSRAGLSPDDIAARENFRAHLLARRKALAKHALVLADTALATPPEKLIPKWRRWWRKWCQR